MIYGVILEGQCRRLKLEKAASGWLCTIDDEADPIPVDAVLPRANVLSLLIQGKVYEVRREKGPLGVQLSFGDTAFAVELRDPRSLRSRREVGGDQVGPRQIVAPMPGRVVRVLVEERAEVEAGQGIIVVEAMKMQNEIKSPKKGTVKKISTTVGMAVNPGDVLAIVE